MSMGKNLRNAGLALLIAGCAAPRLYLKGTDYIGKIEERRRTIVEVSIDGCSPCVEQAKILEAVEADYHDTLQVVRVDREDRGTKKFFEYYGHEVRSFPTQWYVLDDEVICTYSGLQDRGAVIEFIASCLYETP